MLPKARIRKTGEIVTVISYGGSTMRNDIIDYVSYIDSEGNEHPKEKLNYYWDLETVEEPKTEQNPIDIVLKALENNNIEPDWDQIRINASIAAMQGIISNSHPEDYHYQSHCRYLKETTQGITERAVAYADALIKELQKEKK